MPDLYCINEDARSYLLFKNPRSFFDTNVFNKKIYFFYFIGFFILITGIYIVKGFYPPSL